MLPCAFVVGLQGLPVNIHRRSNMFNKLSGKRFTSMSGDTLNIFHRKWMLWLENVVFETSTVNLKAFSGSQNILVTKETSCKCNEKINNGKKLAVSVGLYI